MMHTQTKNRYLITIIMLWVAGMLFTSPVISRAAANETNGVKLQGFQAGNRAYSAKEYAKAIAYYQDTLKDQGFSASLLYNLGNAYQMNGDTGRSILSYERALLLAPGDAQILANLEQVRKNAGLYEDPDMWEMAGRLSFDGWTLLGGTGFTLFAILIFTGGVLGYIKARKAKGTPPYILFKPAAVIFCVLFIAGAAGAYASHRGMKKSIVIHEDAKLLISPFDQANVVSQVEPGRVVYPQKSYGEYQFVKNGKAASGWIRKASITPVYIEE